VKTAARSVVPSRPSRHFVLRLRRSESLLIQLIHISLLDDLHTGRADMPALLAWVEMTLTWSEAARLWGQGEEQMHAALLLSTQLLARARQCGAVRFGSHAEYLQACQALVVMDLLAELCPADIARAAALWSDARMCEIRAGGQALARPQAHSQPQPHPHLNPPALPPATPTPATSPAARLARRHSTGLRVQPASPTLEPRQ
jgi:hypothetical protein